jgi:glycosyltransferase involved in cell wall biosynthesis
VKEGWGLVILEAIAAGLPVITSNQAPFTEFLRPDQALLINPQDVNALAKAMMASVQLEVAELLQQQSQPILGDYSWEASARQHLQCYHQLLSQQVASTVKVGSS